MADKVQKQLEDLVPDLRELLSQDLFSLKEVKNIIEKRREFEFDILSPDPNLSLESYKKYIEYELELDKLIETRYRKIKKTNKLKQIDTKENLNGFNDKSNVNYNEINKKRLRVDINNKRFIHRLFKRCLSRFINNIEVYNSYLSFCKHIKAYKLFERVIMNGLSKNPNDENLWLILGSYVLKNRGLIASKNIIQRSLRLIPNNLNLILYLFQLEVKSLLEIVNTYTEDNQAISENINKLYIIFEYGYKNLSEQDTVVFYFSILSILNELFKQKVCGKELSELLNKLNSKIIKKKIPIITLYNYQIKLLEQIITNNITTSVENTYDSKETDKNKLEIEKEDILLNMFKECFNNAEKSKDSSKGLLILILQFICSTIKRKNKFSEENDNNTEIIIDVNEYNEISKSANEYSNDKITTSNTNDINTEKDYLIKNYCIIENVYYICLLESIPGYYDIQLCKYTSSLAKIDQLKGLRELYLNYLNNRLDEIINFTLKIYPEDINEIYYHLKLLINLSELNKINENITKKLMDKVNEVIHKLITIKSLMGVNDELVKLILKLNIDFSLKMSVFINFKSLNLNHFNFFINRLFSMDFKENEKIELFLLFYRHNEDYEYLKNFLEKLSDLEKLTNFITNNQKYVNNNIYNQMILYVTDRVETMVESLKTDNIEKNKILKYVNIINGWIENKNFNINNENKQKLNNLNIKLKLINCSINC